MFLDGEEALALQATSDQVDDVIGEVGEVGKGLMLDVPVLAVGASHEVGLVGLPLVVSPCRGYVSCAASLLHRRDYTA